MDSGKLIGSILVRFAKRCVVAKLNLIHLGRRFITSGNDTPNISDKLYRNLVPSRGLLAKHTIEYDGMSISGNSDARDSR